MIVRMILGGRILPLLVNGDLTIEGSLILEQIALRLIRVCLLLQLLSLRIFDRESAVIVNR